MPVSDSEFTLAATGDAILTRELTPYEGTDPRFDRMVSTLREADATVTNLEVLVHDYEGYPAAASGGTYMRAPPRVLDELKAVGCDMYAAATNHTFDFSHGGIEATLRHVEERDLPTAGLGTNLYEARKPAYFETPAGRVALVSACSTITPGSEAGEQSPALGGRPGLNPLHVEQVYRVPEDRIDDLRELSELAGFEQVKQSWLDRGLLSGHDWNDEDYFHLGETKFQPVDSVEEAGVAYEVDEADLAAIEGWLAEAASQADHVVMSVHTHEGAGGRQTTKETPAFLEAVAHDCIDAGADAFVAHGPHVVRGVEVYDGAPVCYSLGNWIVQNETVERLPPESYRRYGHDDYTKVSQVFDSRLFDDDGEPKGDLANHGFWETFVPVCRFEGDDLVSFDLYPVTLQGDQPRPQRGLPAFATGAHAEEILQDVAAHSEQFGTDVDVEDGVASVRL